MRRDTASEIDEAAAEWAVRIDRGPLETSVQKDLDDWLSQDRRRQGALWRARAALSLAVQPAPSAQPAPIAQAARKAKPDRRLVFAGLGLAASAALGVLAIPYLSRQRYQTLVGEIRRVPLDDGSMAAINTDTALDVSFEKARRSVKLERGEAWFQVAKDQDRPFVVAAGPVRVQAVGTAFSVRRKSVGAEVRVTEGVVEVWSDTGSGQERMRVGAGEQVFVSDEAGPSAPLARPLEMERALSWRDGQIVFDGDTVAAACAEFNRYNSRKIVVVDPDLEGRTVIGWFRTNEPESFARAVAIAHDVHVEASRDVIMLGGVG